MSRRSSGCVGARAGAWARRTRCSTGRPSESARCPRRRSAWSAARHRSTSTRASWSSVGDGAVRRIVSVSPREVTPARRFAWPACTRAKPAMSLMITAAYDPVFGWSARSIARRNACAVTGALEGGENRKPEPQSERVRSPAVRDIRHRFGDLRPQLRTGRKRSVGVVEQQCARRVRLRLPREGERGVGATGKALGAEHRQHVRRRGREASAQPAPRSAGPPPTRLRRRPRRPGGCGRAALCGSRARWRDRCA